MHPTLRRIASAFRPCLLDAFDPSITERNSRTEWLDGARGWASLFVFFHHFLYGYVPWYDHSYGATDEDNHLLQLPFIRLFFNGGAMVAIFFVISGYSLGHGPMKDVMAGRIDSSRSRVASAILRRPARLLLPPTIATFIGMILLRFGFYDEGERTHWNWDGFGVNEGNPEKLPKFIQQLAHWFEICAAAMYNPLENSGRQVEYDVHLWTMSVELLWSLALYLIMLAMSGINLWPRRGVLLSIYLWFLYRGEWKAMQFVSGLILCHWSLEKVASNRALWDEGLGGLFEFRSSSQYELVDAADDARDEEALKEKTSSAETSNHKWMPISLFIWSLYLLSSPRAGQAYSPGYSMLYHYFTPSWWDASAWWSGRNNALYTFGAPLLIYSISESVRLQRLFSTALSRYLGRISFALYLCHGPMIHMMGNALIPAIWPRLGGPVLDRETWRYTEGSISGFVAGLCIGMAILFPCVIYVADIFTQLVDEPIVRACKRVEGYISIQNRGP